MVIKREKSVRSIFIKYLSYLFVGLVVLILLYMVLLTVLAQNNMIIPSNYYERILEDSRNTIITADKITDKMIPKGCSYGLYDKEGNLLDGNFNRKEAKNAWSAMLKNQNSAGGRSYYKIYHRNNQVCIVKYILAVQFQNPLLQKYLGSPEVLGVVLFFILFIGEILLLSTKFGRYFYNEMKILMRTADQINQQDLNSKMEHSKIREINEVLESFERMKSALKVSLEKQWNMEKARKNQIAALAHDIRTPLTIIKGNAELAREISENEEQIKNNNYIISSANEIEHYLKVLIDISKSEDAFILQPTRIETKHFIEKLYDQEKALAFEKNLELTLEQITIPEYFYADEELLYRAIRNVIVNAVEHSVKNGSLYFQVQGYEKNIKFIVKDSGNGFSKEDIESATEQFYQGDKSRNSKHHYGIGLYITKTFVELHHGTVVLSNCTDRKGAQVVIEIPSICTPLKRQMGEK